jgi:KaiC/GvpD/RAD55 family RecA-like ATPase
VKVSPEHTTVDGIIELTSERMGMHNPRYVAVTKLRGSAFLEGLLFVKWFRPAEIHIDALMLGGQGRAKTPARRKAR